MLEAAGPADAAAPSVHAARPEHRPEALPPPSHERAITAHRSLGSRRAAGSSAPLYLAMAGILLMGFNETRLAGSPVSDVFFVAAAVAIGFNLLAGRTVNLAPPSARRSSPPVLVGTLVFLTGGALSVFESWNADRSITVLLRLAWVTLGWFWVLRSVAVDRAAVGKLLGAWRIMVLFNSAVAVLGQLHIVQWGGLHGSGDRQIGFFGQPNDFAGLLAVGLPVVLLGLPRAHDPGLTRGRELLVRGGPSALVVFALATTGSMSGFVAAAAGGATIVAALIIARPARPARPRRHRNPLLGMVAALGIAGALFALATSDLPVVQRFTEFTRGDSGVTASVDSRGQRDDLIIERFDELLVVGKGFGGFNTSDPQEVEAGGAHNLFLLVALQTGLPGLIGLLVVLLFTAQHALRLIVNTRGTELYGVAVCLLASLVTACTFAMFQPILYHRYFWLPIGLVGALWSLRRQEVRDELSGIALPRYATAGRA